MRREPSRVTVPRDDVRPGNASRNVQQARPAGRPRQTANMSANAPRPDTAQRERVPSRPRPAQRPQDQQSRRQNAPAARPVRAAHEENRPKVAGARPRQADRGRQLPGRRAKTPAPLAKAACVLLAALALLGIGCTGVYALTTPESFNITLDGEVKTIERFSSVNTLVKKGLITSQPGDFLAVDGSIIEAGGGEEPLISVNGKKRAAFLPLREGDLVLAEDGSDITENYSSEETSIEPAGEERGTGAVHAYIDGRAGLVETRTGKKSGATATMEIEPAENNVYIRYNAEVGDDKVIALTFDDGPWPETTEQVLDVLDQYGAKATFFTIGSQIEKHSGSVKRAADSGHQICTHSWDHAAGSGNGVDLTRMSAEEQVAEVVKGCEAIEAATGTTASRVFRAPGGNFSGDIVWTLHDYVEAEIGWNIDTEDWRRPGAESIANRIMKAKSGDIVLMHDGGGDRSQTVEALKTALPYLKEQGYRFVTIDELLAYNDPADMLAKA